MNVWVIALLPSSIPSIGHFQVPKTLAFKTRLSANLSSENEFYLYENKK